MTLQLCYLIILNYKSSYLGGSNLQASGIIKIAKSLQNTSSLTTINVYNNYISKKAADDIAAVLSNNTKLEMLELGKNSLGTVGINKIMKSLQNTSCLISLGIEYNGVDNEAANNIAAVISHNSKLRKLYLDGNSLQVSEISRSLHNISNHNMYIEEASAAGSVASGCVIS